MKKEVSGCTFTDMLEPFRIGDRFDIPMHPPVSDETAKSIMDGEFGDDEGWQSITYRWSGREFSDFLINGVDLTHRIIQPGEQATDPQP